MAEFLQSIFRTKTYATVQVTPYSSMFPSVVLLSLLCELLVQGCNIELELGCPKAEYGLNFHVRWKGVESTAPRVLPNLLYDHKNAPSKIP